MDVLIDTSDGKTRVKIDGEQSVAVVVEDDAEERIYLPPSDDLDTSYYQSDAESLALTDDGAAVVHPRECTKLRILG